MHSLLALAAPLALMLPLVAEAVDVPGEAAAGEGVSSAPLCEPGAAAGQAPTPAAAPRLNPLSALRQSSVVQQVRIEQVLACGARMRGDAHHHPLAEMPQRAPAQRFEERGKEKCVPLAGIAGVQTGSGNRLVLFLRDRRMLSLNLEKACRARARPSRHGRR